MTLAESAPIACSLNAGLRARQVDNAELNRTALVSHRRDDLRLELVYAAAARAQVLEMVRAEQTCCAFLTFEIREEPGALRVIVDAPERARDAVGPLFEALTSKSSRGAGDKTASASTDRAIGTSAALTAAGALACGVCCVLPFALPAAALAATGGILSLFAKATPWAMRIAVVAVLAGWAWVIFQTLRTKRRPARSTLVNIGFSTVVLVSAAVWWHFEKAIIQFIR